MHVVAVFVFNWVMAQGYNIDAVSYFFPFDFADHDKNCSQYSVVLATKPSSAD